MSYILLLLMVIGVTVLVLSLGGSTPPFISKGGEVTMKVTKSATT
jgi:hypothetical protein